VVEVPVGPATSAASRPVRGSVMVVPGGPEGRVLRGGGGRRAAAAAAAAAAVNNGVEPACAVQTGSAKSRSTSEPERFAVCEPTKHFSLSETITAENVCASPPGKTSSNDDCQMVDKHGIAKEYDAMDQFSGGAAEAAVVQESAAQVATATVATAMALEDEGMPDSTAEVLRELRDSGIFTGIQSSTSNPADFTATAKTLIAVDKEFASASSTSDTGEDLHEGELPALSLSEEECW